jgi:hypothetical protein
MDATHISISKPQCEFTKKTIINGCCIFRQYILNYNKIITNVFIVFLESVTNSKILCKFIPYKNEQYIVSFIPPTFFFKLHIKQQWSTLWFFSYHGTLSSSSFKCKIFFFCFKIRFNNKNENLSLILYQNINIQQWC